MSQFRIRDARSGDREAIGALWEELMAYHRTRDPRFTVALNGMQRYTQHMQEMMRSRDSRVLVAETVDTRTVIAYLVGELQSRPPIALPGLYGFISDAYVQEAWRQKGVGRALFEEMRRWFADRKATGIELYVAEANPVALTFWQEMGLRPFLKLLHLDL